MIYCYRTRDGQLVERSFRIGTAPKSIRVDGKTARRSLADETKDLRVGSEHENRPSGTWPMTCVASGVNAEQAPELRNFLKSAGVPTEVTSDGDPIYTSARHRRKALKARGMVDKASFC
jgi:hypothetical protein